MSKFLFPLEAALQWRAHLLKQEKVRLSLLETKRDSTLLLLDQTLMQLVTPISGETDTASLQQGAAYRTHLSGLYQRLQSATISDVKSAEDQLAKCIEADRQCRILEKLRNTRLASWQSAMRKKEEDEAAEIYSAKWSRTNNF